jgi:RNA polymerase sigma factor (sigma-70 family)
MNDWELLQHYFHDGSESAFEMLVKRHVDFVYCAALRQVRNPTLAEDVSQAVFLLLARKAGSFRPGTVLVSWLFRTTRYIAAHALRSEYRRQQRELEAATMNPQTTSTETTPDWERVAPVLDEALAALPGKDRDAVLLRFVSRKSFSQVGAELGASEDAAKKRVSRALARLKQFFAQRGTTLSVAAISLILGERAVQAAPAALATKVTVGLGAGASSAAALMKSTLLALFWNRVKWGTAITAGVIAMLLLVSPAAPRARNGATRAAPGAPTPLSATSADTRRVATEAPGPNKSAPNRRLSLFVARKEDRQPVPKARVLVEYFEGIERRRLLDSATDQDGGLDILLPAQPFNELLVWVSAEGRVPMVIEWHAYEFNEPVIPHTLLLEPGQPAAGIVLDEAGNPVPGAKVSFQGPGAEMGKRESRHFHPELSRSLTDANGRWRTTQLPAPPPLGQVDIRVSHPDFTPASLSVSTLPGFPTNALIILSNGVALGGRVTAADGKPIPNAEIAKQSGVYLNIRTDADGRFFWPHVEPGQVFVDVEAEGFETIHEFVWATNAVNDCALTLRESSNPRATPYEGPPTRVHGSVVDAETGQPIPRFQVLIGDGAPFGANWGPDAALSGARLLGEGRDGQFDWRVTRLFGSRLQVEAEGYLESVSVQQNQPGSDWEFNFKLRRAAILTGRVIAPDGSAVENADVSLTGMGFGPVMQAPGRLLDPNPGFESTRTRTDNKGCFSLKLKTGTRGVAVIHESGSALLTVAAATNYAVVLQPWGAVDGTLYLNGQPAPNQTVSIYGCQKLDADPRVMFSFTYRTTTDERGHFRFDKVLPGEHSVERWAGFFDNAPGVAHPDHSAHVKVESGAVASVELRRQGRPVIGRLVLQGSPDEVQWGMSAATLRGEKSFPCALSRDGALRADDIAPGAYTLSIELAGASIDPNNSPRPPFGTLQKEVIVPPADNESVPVDLGELAIKRAK